MSIPTASLSELLSASPNGLSTPAIHSDGQEVHPIGWKGTQMRVPSAPTAEGKRSILNSKTGRAGRLTATRDSNPPHFATSEAVFQAQVIELARLNGWRLCHFRPALSAKGWRTPMAGDVGFPDLVLLKGDKLIVAELKSESGKLGPGQVEWLAAFASAWVTTAVWRPSDMPLIASILGGRHG